MAQIVPLTSDPARRFELELNGVRLFISTKYNPNADMWSFDMEDSEGILFYGFTMRTAVNLLQTRVDLQQTIGTLWLSDISRQKKDPASDTLGTDVVMLHFPPGVDPDVDAILEGDLNAFI